VFFFAVVFFTGCGFFAAGLAGAGISIPGMCCAAADAETEASPPTLAASNNFFFT
jgi:hypothetical protein